MDNLEDGRVLTDQALVSDGTPTDRHPSGFDPSRYDHRRWLTVPEAESLGYTVEHTIDGLVRSMTTKEGYLVVYGAPSYMNAAWRIFKAKRDSDTHPEGGDASAAPFMGSADPKGIAHD